MVEATLQYQYSVLLQHRRSTAFRATRRPTGVGCNDRETALRVKLKKSGCMKGKNKFSVCIFTKTITYPLCVILGGKEVTGDGGRPLQLTFLQANAATFFQATAVTGV